MGSGDVVSDDKDKLEGVLGEFLRQAHVLDGDLDIAGVFGVILEVFTGDYGPFDTDRHVAGSGEAHTLIKPCGNVLLDGDVARCGEWDALIPLHDVAVADYQPTVDIEGEGIPVVMDYRSLSSVNLPLVAYAKVLVLNWRINWASADGKRDTSIPPAIGSEYIGHIALPLRVVDYAPGPFACWDSLPGTVEARPAFNVSIDHTVRGRVSRSRSKADNGIRSQHVIDVDA